MVERNFYSSPTSLLPQHDVSNGVIENVSVQDLKQLDYNHHQDSAQEIVGGAPSSGDGPCLAMPSNDTTVLYTSGSGGSIPSRGYEMAMSMCSCHGLPMRPEIRLSELVTVARSCGMSSFLVIQGNEDTLASRIQSMFALLVEHALQRLHGFEQEQQAALEPIFRILPTIETALTALLALHTRKSLLSIHEMTSMVFMAFSTLMLTIDEHHLSQCTGVLYRDIASWPSLLASASDKQAFSSMLDLFWLPEDGYYAVAIQNGHVCPDTIPDRLSAQHLPCVALADHIGLREGEAAHICQYYVDCEHTGFILDASADLI